MPPDPRQSPPAVEPDGTPGADDATGGTEAETMPTEPAETDGEGLAPADDGAVAAASEAGTGDEGAAASEVEAPEVEAPVADGVRGRGGLVRPVALGVAAVLLGTFGAWATASAQNLRNASSQNLALTDRAATATVSRQISAEVNTIFSYSYADTAKTKQAAQHVLTGPAVQAYDRLFALVQHNAPAERLVVTTKVVSSGVEFLTSSRARVLLFANQQDTVSGSTQASYGGAMLAVTAVRVSGQWKIENIDTFTNGA